MPLVLLVVLGGLFPIAGAYALGRRLCGGELPHSLALAAGAVILAQAVFLLLVLGWVKPLSLILLGLLALAVGLGRVSFPRTRPGVEWLIFLPFGVLYIVHSMAPEIQPDGYTYHLGLVKEWLRTGALIRRVGFYEVLPQGVEMLFTMAFSIGGHSAAKLVHLAFTLATAPLMAATAKKLGFDGVPAAAFYLFAPVVGVCGTSAYNDTALAFFTLAVFHVLLVWRQENGNRLALLAGLLAGFCYAVKLPGILIAPAVVIFMASLRQWKPAFLAGAAALTVIAPWMARTFLLSGNPVAPLYNRLFPNPHFHATTQEFLTNWLRNYDVPWRQLPWEVTATGVRTGGALGVLFLLAPLGLLALKHRAGRGVWAAAIVAGLPWWWNAGTRFLLPALVFVSLALAMTFGKRVAWVLAILHAFACWPAILDVYAAPGAWRLNGFPWRAALRLEAEPDYLRRTIGEYRVAEMVSQHTRAGDRVLDLVTAANSYLNATLLNPWQSVPAELAVDTLLGAAKGFPEPLYEQVMRWPARRLAAVGFWVKDDAPPAWSIQEIELLHGDEPVRPGPNWRVDASVNGWETRLALDGNPATRWQTWDPRRAGMFLRIDLGKSIALTGVRLILRQPGPAVIQVREETGQWEPLGEPDQLHRPASNLRPDAGRYLRQAGFRFVLTRTGAEGYALLGRELVEEALDWGLQKVAEAEGVHLLAVR